jgi:uncharacterized membrane protein HdeD (DUF308 family)
VKTHRFDPVSLVLGIAAIVVGIAAIDARLGNLVNDRPDALVPLLLLCIGIVAIAIATKRSLQDVDRASDNQYDGSE